MQHGAAGQQPQAQAHMYIVEVAGKIQKAEHAEQTAIQQLQPA